jgi:hypothetical protein
VGGLAYRAALDGAERPCDAAVSCAHGALGRPLMAESNASDHADLSRAIRARDDSKLTRVFARSEWSDENVASVFPYAHRASKGGA